MVRCGDSPQRGEAPALPRRPGRLALTLVTPLHPLFAAPRFTTKPRARRFGPPRAAPSTSWWEVRPLLLPGSLGGRGGWPKTRLARRLLLACFGWVLGWVRHASLAGSGSKQGMTVVWFGRPIQPLFLVRTNCRRGHRRHHQRGGQVPEGAEEGGAGGRCVPGVQPAQCCVVEAWPTRHVCRREGLLAVQRVGCACMP